MLSKSERTILKEILGELGNIRSRLYKQYWTAIDPHINQTKETATADRAVGSVIHALVNVTISTIERVLHFDGQAELGLQMADTLKRILHEENRVSEWEALTHTPSYVENPENARYGRPEWVKFMGVDWGTNDKSVFSEAISRADEEIEAGIYAGMAFSAGSWVKCRVCGKAVEINPDDKISLHMNDIKNEPCETVGSYATITNSRPTTKPQPGRIIESFTFNPLDYPSGLHYPPERMIMRLEDIPSEPRRGRCRFCGNEFNIHNKVISVHGITQGAGFRKKCEGSGELPIPEEPRGLSFFDPGFARRGICSVCKKEWLLDPDGTIPGHALNTIYCDGSHKEPITNSQESETQTQQTTEDECNPASPPQPESKS